MFKNNTISITTTPMYSYPVYIGNLPLNTKLEEVFNHYYAFGSIHEIHFIPTDRNFVGKLGKSAVVSFYSKEAADQAVFETQYSDFMGKTIKVTYKIDPKFITSDCFVNVSSLSFKATEKHLYDHFKMIAPVFSVLIDGDEVHRNIGSATIKFYTPEDAEEAVKTLHKSELLGREINVWKQGVSISYEPKQYVVKEPIIVDDDAMSTASQTQKSEQDVQVIEVKEVKEEFDISESLKAIKENKDAFLSLPINEQNLVLGELMYQRVSQEIKEKKKIGKITGMLADLENFTVDEIIHMLEDNDEFLGYLGDAEKQLVEIDA